jgi:hypothetical protein
MNWVLFLSILIAVESPKTPAQAEAALQRECAVGSLQIRPIFLLDVNQRCEKAVMAKYGRLLTMADMRDDEKAKWTARTYIEHYGKVYTRKTYEKLTVEVAARMFNGGPNGWKRKCTEAYWIRFQEECHRRDIGPGYVFLRDQGEK